MQLTDTSAPPSVGQLLSDEVQTPDDVQRRHRGESVFAKYGLSAFDVTLLFSIVLLTSMYVPFFFTWFWTPRILVMLVALIPGLIALVNLALQRDRAAIAATLVCGWALISATVSGAFFASATGYIGQDTSVVAWTGAFAMWALARSLSSAGRRAAIPVLLGCLGLNAVVGTVQMVFQFNEGQVALLYGRSIGLTPNPVFFGAFMAMGTVMCLLMLRGSWRDRRNLVLLAGMFFFSVNLAFGGSRVALGAVVLLGLAYAVCIRFRSKMVLVGLGLSAGGFVAGTLSVRALGRATDTASRLAQTGSDGRVTQWTAGWNAFTERPVFGYGLGRFRFAIQDELSFDYIASIDNSQVQWDAHNIFVTLLVALGIPGVIFGVAFAWFAIRRASGPAAWGAVAIAITWSLQPAALMTLPLAMFALGVATRSGAGPSDERVDEPSRVVPTWLTVSAMLIGLAAAGWLGVAEVRLNQAVLADDSQAVDDAAHMYLRDPIVMNVAAQNWAYEAVVDPSFQPILLDRLERTVELEPTRPLWWSELAQRQGRSGLIDEAEVSARRALELQPTHIDAWQVLIAVGNARDDDALVTEARDAMCRLGVEDRCESE